MAAPTGMVLPLVCVERGREVMGGGVLWWVKQWEAEERFLLLLEQGG